MDSKIVALIQLDKQTYPQAPFHPMRVYSEFENFRCFQIGTDSQNAVYDGVRELFIQLELDQKNIGTSQWNPLGELVRPGESVVIKPNLVFHKHPFGQEGVESMITHASVIRPIIDYLLLATSGNVKICIADAPLQNVVWDELMEVSGLRMLLDFYRSKMIDIQVIDLRYEVAETNSEGIIVRRNHKNRDPRGSTAVQLGNHSALSDIIQYHNKLEITDYNPGEVAKHHNPTKNEYLIANSVLNADLFINVPKLKTHKKAGITFALKNLIGINCDKSWIAHHRKGSPKSGGDEYRELQLVPRIEFYLWSFLKRYQFGVFLLSLAKKLFRIIVLRGEDIGRADIKKENRPISEGSWYGNDTVWRCIVDLNNIIFFANKGGIMQTEKQRRYLCVGDAIICGEKEGPIRPTPKKVGVLVGGFNPLCVDRAAARIMGFDYTKIPQIQEGFRNLYWRIVEFEEKDILWKSNVADYKNLNFDFIPPINWKGYIERTNVN